LASAGRPVHRAGLVIGGRVPHYGEHGNLGIPLGPESSAHLVRNFLPEEERMIRKLKSGQYRLYSRKKNPKTGRRRNLGTFKSLAAAKKHERAVQFFKRVG
jgi:hypothetical protein